MARHDGAPEPLTGPRNAKFCDVVDKPVPPTAMASCPEVMMLAASDGMSAAINTPHAGTAETEPVPVCVRNFLVVVILPANLTAVGEASS